MSLVWQSVSPWKGQIIDMARENGLPRQRARWLAMTFFDLTAQYRKVALAFMRLFDYNKLNYNLLNEVTLCI